MKTSLVICCYRASRGLDKSVIRTLTQKSAWAAQHENIFVLGPTGVGWITCVLSFTLLTLKAGGLTAIKHRLHDLAIQQSAIDQAGGVRTIAMLPNPAYCSYHCLSGWPVSSRLGWLPTVGYSASKTTKCAGSEVKVPPPIAV